MMTLLVVCGDGDGVQKTQKRKKDIVPKEHTGMVLAAMIVIIV